MFARVFAVLVVCAAITSAQADPASVTGAILACVRVDSDGAVTDAFVLKSSGDATLDGEMLSVIKSHHWDGSQPGWRPQRMTMKGEIPYDMPPSCKPEN